MQRHYITLAFTLSCFLCSPAFAAHNLHDAAEQGNLETCRGLLTKGADANAPNNDGNTPLHLAASNNHKDVCVCLLLAGAHINTPNNHGNTPLHLAASNGHPYTCAFLLLEQAHINTPNNHGSTSLHLAASHSHTSTCAFLIFQGANIHAKTYDGYTPLHLAASSPNGQKLCALLLQRGVDPMVRSPKDETALDLAKKDDIKQFFTTHEATKIAAYLRTIAHDTPQVIIFLVFSFTLGSQWYTYVRR